MLKVTALLSGRIGIYTGALVFSPLCHLHVKLTENKGYFLFFSYTVYSHSLYYPSVEAGQPPTTQRSPPASERTPEEAAGRAGGAGATDEGAPGCQRKQAAGAGDCEEGGRGRRALHSLREPQLPYLGSLVLPGPGYSTLGRYFW